MDSRSHYGIELVLDLHECDTSKFNRDFIDLFLTDLCNLIGMVRCDVHFWDDVGVAPEGHQTLPHAKGTSAICFILTSSIVLHALDILGCVYLNIFSGKAFDVKVAEEFARKRFGGRVVKSEVLDRF